ncbi:hypothetical protein KI387_032947, partial [Taxus chinensis]
MIKALREELKAKDKEIARLQQEKDLTQQKYDTFVSMVEEIGDYVVKAHPHLEPKVLESFHLAMHYVNTLVKL